MLADALAVLALTGLVMAFYWRLITPDLAQRRWFPVGDFSEQFYPFRRYAAAQLATGRLALWSNAMYTGHPFQADSQTAVIYPPSLATELLAAHRGLTYLDLEWEAIIHVALAGGLTYAYLRLLLGRPLPALFGAAAFTFSGYLTGYPSQQLAVLESMTWLPALLACLEWAARAAEAGRPRAARLRLGLAGAALGLAFLAGHPQSFLYLAYVGAAYHAYRALSLGGGGRLWLLAQGALAAVVAFAVAAPQLLPSLQLFAVNARGALDYRLASDGYTLGDLRAVVWPTPEVAGPLHLGVTLLALALLGAALAIASRHASPAMRFWTATAPLALVVCMGHNGPLFWLFYRFLPGWDLFRGQERASSLFTFGACALAAAAVARLTALVEGRRARLAWLLPVGLGLLAQSELWAWNHDNNVSASSPERRFEAPLLRATLRRQPPWERSRRDPDAFPDNVGLVFGVGSLDGNSPFELRRYHQFTSSVFEWRLWQVLGVTHVMTRREFKDGVALVQEDRGVRLYRMLYPVPYAHLVGQAVIAPTQEEAQAVLNRPDFDPGQAVVLEAAPPLALTGGPLPGTAEIIGFSPEEVVVRTRAERPALLVIAQVLYPGWRAYVDGHPAPLLRANAITQAVPLPPGTHTVGVRYMPVPLYAGLCLASLATAALAGLWWVARRERGARAPG